MQKKIAKVVKKLAQAIDLLDPFDGEEPIDCLWQEVVRLEEQINQQAEQIKILQAQVYGLTHPQIYVTPGYHWPSSQDGTLTTGCTRPADENKELDL